MHSPRLQMKKKGDLAPRQQSLHANKPLGSQTSATVPQPVSMSSEAIANLIGKYRANDEGVEVKDADLGGREVSRTTQEICRIAQVISPRKPEEPPAPDPYQDVTPRVFDFMKKSPLVNDNQLSPPIPAPPLQQLPGGLYHQGPRRSLDVSPRQLNPLTNKPYPGGLSALTSPPLPSSSLASESAATARLPGLRRSDSNVALPALSLHPQAPVLPEASAPSQSAWVRKQLAAGGGVANHTSVSMGVVPSSYASFKKGGVSYGKHAATDDDALALIPTSQYAGNGLPIVQSPVDQHSPPRGRGPTTPSAPAATATEAEELLAQMQAATVNADDLDENHQSSALAASNPEATRERLVFLLNHPPGPVHALTADVGMNATTRLSISKLKHQVAYLCQQIITLMVADHDAAPETSRDVVVTVDPEHTNNAATKGSDVPLFDVVVRQRGDVVWSSTSEDVNPLVCDDALNGAGTVGDEESWLMSDDLIEPSSNSGVPISGALDDLTTVKARARKAYVKAMSVHKTRIAQQKETIAKLKATLESAQPGGAKFTQLEDDLQIVREECRKQMGKIRTLVCLLDRAGQTIRYHEDQRHADALGTVLRKENAAQWSQVRRIMPQLDVEPPRTDAGILADIIRFMDQQEDKLSEYSSHTELVTAQLEEAQASFDALQRTNKALQRDLEQTKYELETLRQRRKFEQDERSSSISIGRKDSGSSSSGALVTHGGGGGAGAAGLTGAGGSGNNGGSVGDADRAKLIDRISSLESALKASTEVKSTFASFGVGNHVLPFLRFDPKSSIRNLQLSKMEVENIVCGIWLTRFLSSVSNSRPITESGWISDFSVHGKMPDFSKGASVVKSLERMFILAVQATFSANYAASSAGTASELALGSVGSGGTPKGGGSQPSSATSLSSPTSVPVTGPQLSPDRHAACDFVDDNNVSIWQIKRSEAKRMINFVDHVYRFFLECIQPSACKTCLTLYTVGSGITTPPIQVLQWQKRTELFLQCPQVPTLTRSPDTCVPLPVAEVAYSFIDGCEKYNFDGDINMVRRVLLDELPEAAFFDMMIMVEKLRVALLNSHTLYAPPFRWPSPTVATVLHVLKRFFPRKSPGALQQLQRSLLLDMKETAMNSDAASVTRMMRSAASAAARSPASTSIDNDGSRVGVDDDDALMDLPMIDFGGDGDASAAASATHEALRTPVDVARLFSSTESGNQGYFLESLKGQYMHELMRYIDDVKEAILACGDDAPATSTVITGVPMIDGQQLTALEKSKKRRASVASYFQLQERTTAGDATMPTTTATLRAIVDQLQALDPAKPLSDIENYVYHVLQLYYMHKSKQLLGNGGDAGGVGSGGGGLDPVETELSNLSKDELWKRQTRATSYAVPVHAFVRFCGRVLYRRASVQMHSDPETS